MYGEYLTAKHNVHTANDAKTTLEHIDNPVSVYFKSNYIFRVYMTVVLEDKSTHLVQTIMVNRGQLKRK